MGSGALPGSSVQANYYNRESMLRPLLSPSSNKFSGSMLSLAVASTYPVSSTLLTE